VKAIDLFSGAGGFSTGAELAGVQVARDIINAIRGAA